MMFKPLQEVSLVRKLVNRPTETSCLVPSQALNIGPLILQLHREWSGDFTGNQEVGELDLT